MGRPGISYEQVANAAEALLAGGQSPTVQRVREQLGRGSHSTIAAHLRRFHQADQDQALPEPPQSFTAACQTLWSQALHLADERFDAERGELDRKAEVLAADREDLLRRHQWLRISLGERDRLLADCRRTLSSQEEALTQERQAREGLVREVEKLRRQLAEQHTLVSAKQAELERHQAQARRLEDTLRAELASERERSETEQQRQLLELDRFRVRLEQTRREHERLGDQQRLAMERAQEERHALLRERVLWEGRCTALSSEGDNLRRENTRLSTAMENARRVIAQLRQRLARRSGGATTTGRDIVQGGSASGMDGHHTPGDING